MKKSLIHCLSVLCNSWDRHNIKYSYFHVLTDCSLWRGDHKWFLVVEFRLLYRHPRNRPIIARSFCISTNHGAALSRSQRFSTFFWPDFLLDTLQNVGFATVRKTHLEKYVFVKDQSKRNWIEKIIFILKKYFCWFYFKL